MIIYLGLNPRWQRFSWLPDKLNVMFSAGGYWDGSQFRRDKFFTHGLKFLDSGGFTLLNKYGDYPFTNWEYLNLVARLQPDYFATTDYPCEPDITRSLSLMDNKTRIDKTVENALWISDHADVLGGQSQPINVIQGYTLDEYKYCIDQHNQAGTIRDYMAVGSMCRRISTPEIMKLIPGIAEHAAQAGVQRLHWFGLKLDRRLDGMTEHIYSRDTAAIYHNYGGETVDGRRWPRGPQEKRQRIERYLSLLDRRGLVWASGG